MQLDKGLKLIAKSSLIVFIGFSLSKILAYIYRIIIARHYGSEAYGVFSLAIMILGFILVFADLGMQQGILRYISIYRGKKQLDKSRYLFKKTIKFIRLTSILSGTLLLVFSNIIAIKIFNTLDLAIFLKIFAFLVPIGAFSAVYLSAIRAYEKINWFSFINYILKNAAMVLILIIAVFFKFGPKSIPVSYFMGSFFVFIFAYFVCKKSLTSLFEKTPKNKKHNNKLFSEMFSYSWPLILFGLTASVLYWTDSIIIGIFRTVKEVGWYNAAVPIALLLTLSKDIFVQLFFPLVTKEYAKGNKELVSQLSKQVGKWVFILSLPFFMLFMIFPGEIIKLLFGSEYMIAKNTLRFLSIGVLFMSVLDISRELISMKGYSKLMLKDIIFVSIINIILNIVLVPKFGIDGAGFSTMISLITLNLIFVFQSKKYLNIIPLRKKMGKVFLISLIPLIIILTIKLNTEVNSLLLVSLGIFFILAYILLIILSGGLDINDKKIIQILKRKILFFNNNNIYKNKKN